MRKLGFVVALILKCLIIDAQTVLPSKNRKVTYEEVVTVDSSNTKQLYIKALAWFAQEFKSAKDVIQMQDQESGVIIGKGNSQMEWPGMLGTSTKGPLSFMINVSAKDGRYKYNLTNFTYQDYGKKYPAVDVDRLLDVNNKLSEKAKVRINEIVQQMIQSLKASMAKNESW